MIRHAGLAALWPWSVLLWWALSWCSVVVSFKVWGWGSISAALGVLAACLFAFFEKSWWRRAFIVAGFLASELVVLKVSISIPLYLWLAPVAIVLSAYPVSAWRGAPIFPTPAGALVDLSGFLSLPDGVRVLDAGSGSGAGLKALREAFPKASIEGFELSPPLVWLSRLRCPWAKVFRQDIWSSQWTGYALVYMFQRPESMRLAWEKACREMLAGSIFVSLEFPVPDVIPCFSYATPGGKRVWCYQTV